MSLSHTHTHTHTHTNTNICTHTYNMTSTANTKYLSWFPSLQASVLNHTVIHYLSAYCHSVRYQNTHTHTHTHSHSLTHSHTHTHTYFQSLNAAAQAWFPPTAHSPSRLACLHVN